MNEYGLRVLHTTYGLEEAGICRTFYTRLGCTDEGHQRKRT
jgi:hypothetical protein